MKKKKDQFHYSSNHEQSMSSIAFFGAPNLTPSSNQQLSDYIQEEEKWTSEDLDVILNNKKEADN